MTDTAPETNVDPHLWEVRDDCPSRLHNSLYAHRKVKPRCICSGAEKLYQQHLAAQRNRTPTRRTMDDGKQPKLPSAEGPAARVLLARYDAPPHACVDEDPELWFSPIPSDQALAREICGGCPLRETCHQAAIDNGWEGVWGGADEDDRRAERNSLTRAS